MANLLIDLTLTSAHSVTGSWADIAGMSQSVTIAGPSSVVILTMSLNPEMAVNLDFCAEYRFTHDGSPVGPELSAFSDNANEGSGRTITFALTGLSAGSHTFAVQAQNRESTVIIDTAYPRAFQCIEIESGASILVDLSSVTSDSAPATYANVANLSQSKTPAAGALLLFITGITQLDTADDDSADYRFAIDGTRDGPELAQVNDDVDNVTSLAMAWAVTGVTAAAHTFSVQWQQRNNVAEMDTTRARIFQVVEITTDFDLLVDKSSVASNTAPGTYADMVDMTGSPDIAGTDSVALLLANYSQLDQADSTADNRFKVAGTQEGAEVSIFTDSASSQRSDPLLMARAITGHSGVIDVSLQWQTRRSTSNADTARPRTFQVIDLQVQVAGDIAAALSIITTVAADLDAQGKLDAALNLVLTQAADLAAAGDLDAALPIVLSVIADLKGAGELSAVQSIILTIAADLTALGSLSAAALIALTVAADLDAEGEIQAALAIVLSVAADLDAPGTLSAALGIVLTVAADLIAAGELRAAANIILTVVADITAPDVNDMQAALDIVLTVAADLEAEGKLDAALNIVLTQAAELTADGPLEAALPIILSVIADLKGAGELSAAQSIILTVAADLAASGSLNAALDIVLSVAADLDAVGQLTANMQIVLSMAADLKAKGELRAALGLVLTVVAELTHEGNLAAAMLIRLTISADLQDTPPAPPVAPIQGGSPGAPPGVPTTVTLTEQQVVQRQLQREDDEAMSVVLSALGLISK